MMIDKPIGELEADIALIFEQRKLCYIATKLRGYEKIA